MLPTIAARIVGVVVANVIGLSMGSIFVWFDRRTDSPIMKRRINKGSDKFFADETERQKEIVLRNRLEFDDF